MSNTWNKRGTSYVIQLGGRLDERWSDWFDGLTISHHVDQRNAPLTVLTGPIIDQAALHGILTSVRDLNLNLISVHRIESGPPAEGGEEEREDEQNPIDGPCSGHAA